MALGNNHIEDVAASLVREYLSRKGLKMTLQVMDEEMPRTRNSISNRQSLMKEVKIEKIMKKNKDTEDPLRTMIEVMSRFFIERSSATRDSPNFGLPASDCPSPSSQTSPRSGSGSSRTSNGSDGLMTVKARPTTSQVKSRKQNMDIVIDDDIDSETLLGGGKSGLFTNEKSDPITVPRTRQGRPLSSKQRPMSGAVMSNLDDSGRRRGQKTRPTGSTGSRTGLSTGMTSHSILPARADTLLSEVSRNSYAPHTQVGKEEKTVGCSNRNTEMDLDPKNSRSIVSIEDVLERSTERLDQISRRKSQTEITRKQEKSYSVDMSSMSRDRPKSRGAARASEQAKTVVGDVEFGDMDDFENDMSDLRLGPVVTPNNNFSKLNTNKLDSKPIDTQTAVNLKVLIHGMATLNFNDEWFYQSFSFCDLPGLQYGIVQKKGGPCGILASVQACMLQEMLFGENRLPQNKCLDPSRNERSMFLAQALTRIFWRAGESRKAVVAIPSGRTHVLASTKFKHDNLTETLMLYTFTNYDELLSFMKQSVPQFEIDGNSGVILVLYSALLSRGLDRARKDLDEPGGKLMAAHGYCTQEMVNLLLTGRAVANVFNDVMELDSGSDEVTVLKGIHTRSDIGFLSLFEHYKSCQVGTYYKTPKFPIWVVCSESHFSVLFSVRRELISDWKAERRFDLFYYDGLARQQEQIKLSVDTSNRFYKPPSDEELVPPLDHCIRTKWDEAEVDWNGYEPIL